MDRSLVQIVACSPPAFRSTSMVIARPVRSTPSRASPIAPPRQTVTPLIVTSTRSGSNAASVVPIAASTRPQLGSLPNSAVLSRLLRAHARPAVSASVTLTAPRTVIAMSLVEPSASASSCIARSVAAAVSASVNSSAPGVTPLAPLAITITVSLVDRQPSESTRSTLTLVARFSAGWSACGGTTASVVSTTSIVARLGASIPAPLAIPPTVHPSRVCTVVLGTESVVMIARAASGPPSSDSAFTAAVTPAVSRSIGSRTPISPVLQTATSIAPRPSSAAACSAVAWVSPKPSGPVQALAPPELSTTARARSPASTCRLHSTGAAGKRLVVNTAAAASSGPWLRTTATSRPPLDFSPAAPPAAEKPLGAVVLTMPSVRSRAALRSSLVPRCDAHAAVRSRRDPHDRQAGGLGQPQGQVGALDRRTPGARGQVVHRRHHHQPPGIGVHGQLQRHGVRPQHLRRARPLPLRQQVHERLLAVGLLIRRPNRRLLDPRRQRRRAGRQDAPAHRHQRRREADRHLPARGPGQALHHLRRVPVHPTHPVGAHRPQHLAAQQMRLHRPARPRGPRRGDHHHLGLHQPGGQRRGQRQAHRGRIAAGHRDPPRTGQPRPLAGQLGQPVGPGTGVLAAVPPGPGG